YTGISYACAACFTGDAANCLFLPLGWSGCVTTATTWCSLFISLSKMGTEKSGVPIKIIRVKYIFLSTSVDMDENQQLSVNLVAFPFEIDLFHLQYCVIYEGDSDIFEFI